MSSSNGSVDHCDDNTARVIPFHGVATRPNKAHFATSLQMTLDLSSMFHLFAERAQILLNWDSLQLRNEKQAIDISYGQKAVHSLFYRLAVENEHLGDLYCTRRKMFKAAELSILESLLCDLVYPLRNALLYQAALQAAMRDPLTGIANRQALQKSLQDELNLQHRCQTPLSLLIMDIDFFKQINDAYGHDAGDQVLKAVAQQLSNIMRNSDLLFRYGGEEFVALLRNTPSSGALLLAERARQAIAQLACQYAEHTLKVTISIGCTSLLTNDTAIELFKRADKALYLAKNAGRNRSEQLFSA